MSFEVLVPLKIKQNVRKDFDSSKLKLYYTFKYLLKFGTEQHSWNTPPPRYYKYE